jgi:hypothetical protein
MHLTPAQLTYYKQQARNRSDTAESRAALIGLSRYMPTEICLLIAKNPVAPNAALAILSTNEDWKVRHAVVEHPNTSWEVLLELQKVECVDAVKTPLSRRLVDARQATTIVGSIQ